MARDLLLGVVTAMRMSREVRLFVRYCTTLHENSCFRKGFENLPRARAGTAVRDECPRFLCSDLGACSRAPKRVNDHGPRWVLSNRQQYRGKGGCVP